jgi:hypothetical protein
MGVATCVFCGLGSGIGAGPQLFFDIVDIDEEGIRGRRIFWMGAVVDRFCLGVLLFVVSFEVCKANSSASEGLRQVTDL